MWLALELGRHVHGSYVKFFEDTKHKEKVDWDNLNLSDEANNGKYDDWIDACAKEIEAAAKKNNRSVNEEMKARFAASADSPSNSDRLDEIRETLNKHDEKLDKLADMLGRVCEVINANQTRT